MTEVPKACAVLDLPSASVSTEPFWSEATDARARQRFLRGLLSRSADSAATAQLEALFEKDDRAYGPSGWQALGLVLDDARRRRVPARRDLAERIARRLIAQRGSGGLVARLRALLLLGDKPATIDLWRDCTSALTRLPVDRGGPTVTMLHLEVAQTMLDYGRMATIIGRVAAATDRSSDLSQTHRALQVLVARWGGCARIEFLAQRLHELDPGSPVAIDNLVRSGVQRGRAVADFVGACEALDPDTSPVMACRLFTFVAHQAVHAGLEAQAVELFRKYPAKDWPPFIRSMRQAILQNPDDLADPVETIPPVTGEVSPHPARVVSAEAITRSTEDLFLESGGGAETVSRRHADFVARVAAIEPAVGESAADWLRAARDCQAAARSFFGNFAHHADLLRVAPSRAYGTVDLFALQAAHSGLVSVAEALARAALGHVLSGALICRVAEIGELAEILTACALAADHVADALALIEEVARTGVAKELLWALRRQCLLQMTGPDGVGRLAFDDPGAVPVRVSTHADWTRLECIRWAPLLEDAQRHGEFTVVWPDGLVQRQAYETLGVTVSISSPLPLTRLNEGVVIGAHGGILRPHGLHFRGAYPASGARVAASGTRGAVIDLSDATIVSEPVLLLEAFDALDKRNYYHWMVFLLPRIVLAFERGLLAERRLVLPSGLRGWMADCIRLCGVPENRLLILPTEVPVQFTNAVLMASVEVASETLLGSVARRILTQAPPPDPNLPRCLFLSRSAQWRRKLINEAEIEALAQRMGFVSLRPETLSITRQAQLFAGARAIVAPEGAALTNTLFCPPGARVVSILGDADMFPTFNDLSIVMGHPHRKVACPPVPALDGRFSMWSSFAADPALVEKAMNWALGETDD